MTSFKSSSFCVNFQDTDNCKELRYSSFTSQHRAKMLLSGERICLVLKKNHVLKKSSLPLLLQRKLVWTEGKQDKCRCSCTHTQRNFPAHMQTHARHGAKLNPTPVPTDSECSHYSSELHSPALLCKGPATLVTSDIPWVNEPSVQHSSRGSTLQMWKCSNAAARNNARFHHNPNAPCCESLPRPPEKGASLVTLEEMGVRAGKVSQFYTEAWRHFTCKALHCLCHHMVWLSSHQVTNTRVFPYNRKQENLLWGHAI